MSDPSLVLVTGATGAVGPAVVKELRERGYRVRSLSLDGPPGEWPADVDVRTGDITNKDDVESAMTGAGSVIHMAALLHRTNVSEDMYPDYERINIDGTMAVARAAIAQGVGRIVFFSTISVYGPSGKRVLTEESPVSPDTIYARTKLAGEAIVLGARDNTGNPIGTVLRLAAVYGANIKGNYRSLTDYLAKKRFIPIGKGENRRTLVHDEDVARSAVLALENPAAAGKVFNVSDGQFHTMREIIAAICKALGRKEPSLYMPECLVRPLVKALVRFTRLTGLKSPFSLDMIDKYTEDLAVDASRIRAVLGFQPKYGLWEGWTEVIREMRRYGRI